MSGTPATRISHAQTLMAAGRWQEAHQALATVLAESPDHPQALATMAECWLGLGNAEEALTFATRAATQDPSGTAPLVLRSRALSTLGRHKESREAADAAVRLDPNGYLVHLQRASVDGVARKATPGGRSSMQTVLSLAPNEADAHVVAGNLSMADRNLAAAKHSYQTALGLAPDHQSAQYNLALIGQHTFGWATSAKLLRGLIQMNPSDPRYTMMLRSALSLTLVIAALWSGVLIMFFAVPGPDRPDPDATRMLLVLGGSFLLQVIAVLWVRRIGGRSAFQFLAPGRLGTGWRTTLLYLAATGIVLVDLCLVFGILFVDIAGTLAGVASLLSLVSALLVIVSAFKPPETSPSG